MKYIFLFLFPIIFACNNASQEQPSNTDTGSAALPEGFLPFYQQFHADSIFQMEHITFPLQGLPNNTDRETIDAGTFRWQKEEWSMMQPIDFEMSDYRRELIPVTDEMVVERIVHKNGQFGMVRRFAIISGDWHLIYYAGVNRLAQN